MFRCFHALKLHFDRLIVFPAALTLRHTIDESSPLHGETIESLDGEPSPAGGFSGGCRNGDTRRGAKLSSDYTWQDIRFGERFVDIYTDHGNGRLTVDYARIHETGGEERR